MSEPQMDIYISSADRVLFHAGLGSGKTFLMCLVLWRFVTQFPNIIGMIAANTYGQLSDSTLFAIFKALDLLGIKEYNESNPDGFFVMDKQPPACFTPHGYTFKTNSNKIFWRNGAVTLLASLDNYKAIDGRTIGYALLDETKDTKEAAIKEVIVGRLREKGIFATDNPMQPFSNNPKQGREVNPLYIFTSPAKSEWLRKYFHLDARRDEILRNTISDTNYYVASFEEGTAHEKTKYCVVCSSTYHNKHNLSANYIPTLKSGLSPDMVDLNVYGSPFGKTGGEYYPNFSRDEHVKEVEIDSAIPLHITFDFNAKPYMTLLVSQVTDTEFNIIDEYTLKAPRNTIEDICSAFVADYEHLSSAGVFFYGDASGKNSMPIKASRDLYKIVERELAMVYPIRRLLTQNPRHRSLGHSTLGRRDFMNAFLNGKYGINFNVSPRCVELIADLEFTKEDANGAKMKEKVTVNGESYESRGHCTDALDYEICYLFGGYNKEK